MMFDIDATCNEAVQSIDQVQRIISILTDTNIDEIYEYFLDIDPILYRPLCNSLINISAMRVHDVAAFAKLYAKFLNNEQFRNVFEEQYPMLCSSMQRRVYDLTNISIAKVIPKLTDSSRRAFADLIPEYYTFCDNCDEIKITRDWVYHFFHPKSISRIIYEDNLIELVKISTDPKFDVDREAPIGFFLSSNLRAYLSTFKRIPLIDMAALCGSVRCFRFLYLSGSIITDQTMKLAIAGGSSELVRLCEQAGIGYTGMSQSASLFFRYDLYDWLKETNGEVCPNLSNLSSLLDISKEYFLANMTTICRNFPFLGFKYICQFWGNKLEEVPIIPSLNCIPADMAIEWANILINHGLNKDLLFASANTDPKYIEFLFQNTSPFANNGVNLTKLSGIIANCDTNTLAQIEEMASSHGINLYANIDIFPAIWAKNEELCEKIINANETINAFNVGYALSFGMYKTAYLLAQKTGKYLRLPSSIIYGDAPKVAKFITDNKMIVKGNISQVQSPQLIFELAKLGIIDKDSKDRLDAFPALALKSSGGHPNTDRFEKYDFYQIMTEDQTKV